MSRVVIAHPSPDLYGSDRQMLESVDALVAAGWDVDLVLPGDGPLVPLARERGARVVVVDFPVLRKAVLHPRRLIGFLAGSVVALLRAARRLRALRPALLYVNTVTVPVWVLAGRLAGVPVLVHVHEAEEASRLVATLLNAPLLLARRVVVNSAAAASVLLRAVPRLASRTEVVHNGVPGPPEPIGPAEHGADEPWRLVVVGRLSPRKGTDVALDAVGLLVAEGLDVRLTVAGTPFSGYEWFEEQLRERAARPDLEGRVTFAGYVHPTWPLLADNHVVLVPSRVEPFGNTAVEALHAGRAVVASRTQGLVEVVDDGRTGLLATAGDAHDLAARVRDLLKDDDLRAGLAAAGREDAAARFTTRTYGERLLRAVDAAVPGNSPGPIA